MDGQSERELIHKASRGDADAFGIIVGMYDKRVYNMAKNICGHAEDALDISQEVFMRVWRGLPSFRGDSSFSTWLFRLTSNACIDSARKKARRHEIPFAEPGDDERRASDGPSDDRYSPESMLEKKDLRRALAEALDKLSPEHRKVLVMRENAGLSYCEIAKTLGIEEGTVKSRIARARAQMRLFLTRGGNFEGNQASK